MKKQDFKELVIYIVVGVMTTVVNYMSYYGLLELHFGWLLANTIAWIGAVIFAFIANREVVFQSQDNIKDQAIQFVTLRLLTLFVENALLFVFISLMGVSMYLAKIIVSVVTVVSNYGLCKFKIFHSRKEAFYE